MSESSKPKILVILSRFPYPLEKGDKLRAYHQIKELSEYFEVTLFALSDKAVTDNHQAQLRPYCSTIHVERIHKLQILLGLLRSLLNGKPFQVGYFYHKAIKRRLCSLIADSNFDHIYCQLIRTSEYVKHLHHIPKTLDYMDALAYGMSSRAERKKWFNAWIYRNEARRLSNYERHIFDYFEVRTIISEQDRKRIKHPENQKILVIPNGIDEAFFVATESSKHFELVFVGNMSYAPNVDAAEYLAQEILPQVPNCSLLLAGANPHKRVLALKASNVHISGWVEDIRESYTQAHIFIAPMRIGTGLQNKLLEAMALGIPCITTTLANNALGAENNKSICIADSVEETKIAIEHLLKEEEFAKQIAQNGQALVRQTFNWKQSTSQLIQAIKASLK